MQQFLPLTIATSSIIPPITRFSGTDPASTPLWLKQTQHTFHTYQQLFGFTLTDSQRIAIAVASLEGDAARWFHAMAIDEQPTTWTHFADSLRRRFEMIRSKFASHHLLTALVNRTAAVRNRLTLAGLTRFGHRFVELASQVPEEYLSFDSRIRSFLSALPDDTRLRATAEYQTGALTGSLVRVVGTVLDQEHTRSLGRYALASSAQQPLPNIDAVRPDYMQPQSAPDEADPDAMQLTAILAAATVLDISRDEAHKYFTEASCTTAECLSAALTSVHPTRRQRRSQPAASRHADVPPHLTASRRAAGLCIRCGKHKHSPGREGHNARTCPSVVDTTTLVEDGLLAARTNHCTARTEPHLRTASHPHFPLDTPHIRSELTTATLL